jgi:hypothetical protein
VVVHAILTYPTKKCGTSEGDRDERHGTGDELEIAPETCRSTRWSSRPFPSTSDLDFGRPAAARCWRGWIRTIHHGLPERLLTPQPVAPAYFAFLGRISPEKAVDQAIWIAKRCGVPLKIAAKVDAVDRDYFESEIRKLLTPPTRQRNQ